jgi:hypothetical protein
VTCEHPSIFGTPGAVRLPLGLPDNLIGEEDDVALEGLGIDEAHSFLVAGLAEEALASPEHDREDPAAEPVRPGPHEVRAC